MEESEGVTRKEYIYSVMVVVITNQFSLQSPAKYKDYVKVGHEEITVCAHKVISHHSKAHF